MVHLQIEGRVIPEEQLRLLAARLLLDSDENIKLITVAEKIEAVFAQEKPGAEEVDPLVAERELGNMIAARDRS
jgi:hypothetical protein